MSLLDGSKPAYYLAKIMAEFPEQDAYDTAVIKSAFQQTLDLGRKVLTIITSYYNDNTSGVLFGQEEFDEVSFPMANALTDFGNKYARKISTAGPTIAGMLDFKKDLITIMTVYMSSLIKMANIQAGASGGILGPLVDALGDGFQATYDLLLDISDTFTQLARIAVILGAVVFGVYIYKELQ